ncbi:hypothetical protein [Telmatospirillum sp.]|uniref:hypothetical protein n=1 Tax=Telmatospirillum sp. TaxID=2079197 RepID=UPI002846E901|nr:hypothetical protein [Telmatospirillum sp.]MDR3437605.1 hypothetical protein [Telmatospirillum sp.]
MMKLLRHERVAVMFLIRHLLVGVVGALLFGGLVLLLDIAHLRSLAAQSQDGVLTLALFFFGLTITFGSVAMGIGIMSLAQDDN